MSLWICSRYELQTS